MHSNSSISDIFELRKMVRKDFFLLFPLLLACQPRSDTSTVSDQELSAMPTFVSVSIAADANLWWARALADVDGDQILDVVLIDNNGSAGWLGYLKGNLEGLPWERHIVAEQSPNGKPFAAGDLACADMDGDGDMDLIGVEHPGEWTDADADATLFWYAQEDGSWRAHEVGVIPSALKDISLEDLDQDGLPEIITVTYNAETLSLFSRNSDGDYTKMWDLIIDNLHEGMDVGDVDGDGWKDIATNGYWLRNPGQVMAEWPLLTIDDRWFNQEDDHWSRNATKVLCTDMDADGKDEVLISHSERAGYPLARYDLEDGRWEMTILIDSVPAAHSLVTADINLDGTIDVMTGVNRNRAINIVEERGDSLAMTEFPVLIWNQGAIDTINKDGVYNLLAGDIEGDGDMDLVRLTSHDEKDMWLMLNQQIK